MIRSGRLRHRVRIKEAVETVLPDGSVRRVWETIAVRWCGIINETGRELMEADRPQDRTRCRLTLRGMEQLRESHRIEDGPFRYGVDSISDREEKGAVVEVLCTRKRLNCLTVGGGLYVTVGGEYISVGEDG